MINIIQDKDIYKITFRYDPNIVAMVKQVPGRRWHPDEKYWSIEADNLGIFMSQLKGTSYEQQVNIQSDENININKSIEMKVTIPDIDISDVEFKVTNGSKAYRHQLDFMKYAIDRQNHKNMSGFLLCDQMGLGKTLEILNLAKYNQKKYGFKHCLIICCVNNSKYNWADDAEIHLNEECYILGSRLTKKSKKLLTNTGTKEKLEDLKCMKKYGDPEGDDIPYFIVTNIETLRAKQKKNFVIVDQLIKLINSGKINMIAIDEIHKNCSPQANQGKQILRMKKETGKRCMWIPITGTPIVNKPTDVFTPLKLVDGHDYTSYWMWCQNYCLYGGYGGHEIVGYKNIPSLQKKLHKHMLRRLKDDVLDLPPKIYHTEYVTNTSTQEDMYSEIASGILREREEIITSLNPLAQMMKLRQVNGYPEVIDPDIDRRAKSYLTVNAKLQKLLDLIEEIHERGEKVLIFSNWVEPLRTLYLWLNAKYGVRCYTGTMSEAERQKQKDQFINDDKYTIMMGTIGAMGTSHTFTVATNIIFYDEPWTVADYDQCCDRCHRISTTQPVDIYTIITKDTVDERVHDILYSKRGMSSFIVDNIDIHSNPELFDVLLADSIK